MTHGKSVTRSTNKQSEPCRRTVGSLSWKREKPSGKMHVQYVYTWKNAGNILFKPQFGLTYTWQGWNRVIEPDHTNFSTTVKNEEPSLGRINQSCRALLHNPHLASGQNCSVVVATLMFTLMFVSWNARRSPTKKKKKHFPQLLITSSSIGTQWPGWLNIPHLFSMLRELWNSLCNPTVRLNLFNKRK